METLELEILRQLGGQKFVVMTGIHACCTLDNGLQFSFRGSRVANKCRITLDNDIYTVEFFRLRAGKCIPIQKYDDVYADMLQNIFTSTTGLDCTL